jgi:hypothetical protein
MGRGNSVLYLPRVSPQIHLYHKRHRGAELKAAAGRQSEGPLSQLRGCDKAALFDLEPIGKREEAALARVDHGKAQFAVIFGEQSHGGVRFNRPPAQEITDSPHSSPSIKDDAFAIVSFVTPSPKHGLRNWPLSKRLLTSTNSVPSHGSSLSRGARLLRSTNSTQEKRSR